MARKKTSPAEDIMDRVAMFPWWVGVALAVMSYFALHYVASQPMASLVQPGQVSAIVTQTVWRTFASVGQYLLPILCLAGAGISARRRRERKQLLDNVVRSDAADHVPEAISAVRAGAVEPDECAGVGVVSLEPVQALLQCCRLFWSVLCVASEDSDFIERPASKAITSSLCLLP